MGSLGLLQAGEGPTEQSLTMTPIAPGSKRAKDLIGAITKLFKKVAGFRGVSILPKDEFAAKVDEGKGKGMFANTRGDIWHGVQRRNLP